MAGMNRRDSNVAKFWRTLLLCTTTGACGSECRKTVDFRSFAVHQGRRRFLRCAEVDFQGPCGHGDSAVTLGFVAFCCRSCSSLL